MTPIFDPDAHEAEKEATRAPAPDYFCTCCLDYVATAAGCARCDIKTVVPENSSEAAKGVGQVVLAIPAPSGMERLFMPLGCCDQCRAASKTGDQCWDSHFTPKKRKRRCAHPRIDRSPPR